MLVLLIEDETDNASIDVAGIDMAMKEAVFAAEKYRTYLLRARHDIGYFH